MTINKINNKSDQIVKQDSESEIFLPEVRNLTTPLTRDSIPLAKKVTMSITDIADTTFILSSDISFDMLTAEYNIQNKTFVIRTRGNDMYSLTITNVEFTKNDYGLLAVDERIKSIQIFTGKYAISFDNIAGSGTPNHDNAETIKLDCLSHQEPVDIPLEIDSYYKLVLSFNPNNSQNMTYNDFYNHAQSDSVVHITFTIYGYINGARSTIFTKSIAKGNPLDLIYSNSFNNIYDKISFDWTPYSGGLFGFPQSNDAYQLIFEPNNPISIYNDFQYTALEIQDIITLRSYTKQPVENVNNNVVLPTHLNPENSLNMTSEDFFDKYFTKYVKFQIVFFDVKNTILSEKAQFVKNVYELLQPQSMHYKQRIPSEAKYLEFRWTFCNDSNGEDEIGTLDIQQVNDMFLAGIVPSINSEFIENINNKISSKTNIIPLMTNQTDNIIPIKCIIANTGDNINTAILSNSKSLSTGIYDIKISLSHLFGDEILSKIYHLLFNYIELKVEYSSANADLSKYSENTILLLQKTTFRIKEKNDASIYQDIIVDIKDLILDPSTSYIYIKDINITKAFNDPIVVTNYVLDTNKLWTYQRNLQFSGDYLYIQSRGMNFLLKSANITRYNECLLPHVNKLGQAFFYLLPFLDVVLFYGSEQIDNIVHIVSSSYGDRGKFNGLLFNNLSFLESSNSSLWFDKRYLDTYFNDYFFNSNDRSYNINAQISDLLKCSQKANLNLKDYLMIPSESLLDSDASAAVSTIYKLSSYSEYNDDWWGSFSYLQTDTSLKNLTSWFNNFGLVTSEQISNALEKLFQKVKYFSNFRHNYTEDDLCSHLDFTFIKQNKDNTTNYLSYKDLNMQSLMCNEKSFVTNIVTNTTKKYYHNIDLLFNKCIRFDSDNIICIDLSSLDLSQIKEIGINTNLYFSSKINYSQTQYVADVEFVDSNNKTIHKTVDFTIELFTDKENVFISDILSNEKYEYYYYLLKINFAEVIDNKKLFLINIHLPDGINDIQSISFFDNTLYYNNKIENTNNLTYEYKDLLSESLQNNYNLKNVYAVYKSIPINKFVCNGLTFLHYEILYNNETEYQFPMIISLRSFNNKAIINYDVKTLNYTNSQQIGKNKWISGYIDITEILNKEDIFEVVFHSEYITNSYDYFKIYINLNLETQKQLVNYSLHKAFNPKPFLLSSSTLNVTTHKNKFNNITLSDCSPTIINNPGQTLLTLGSNINATIKFNEPTASHNLSINLLDTTYNEANFIFEANVSGSEKHLKITWTSIKDENTKFARYIKKSSKKNTKSVSATNTLLIESFFTQAGPSNTTLVIENNTYTISGTSDGNELILNKVISLTAYKDKDITYNENNIIIGSSGEPINASGNNDTLVASESNYNIFNNGLGNNTMVGGTGENTFNLYESGNDYVMCNGMINVVNVGKYYGTTIIQPSYNIGSSNIFNIPAFNYDIDKNNIIFINQVSPKEMNINIENTDGITTNEYALTYLPNQMKPVNIETESQYMHLLFDIKLNDDSPEVLILSTSLEDKPFKVYTYFRNIRIQCTGATYDINFTLAENQTYYIAISFFTENSTKEPRLYFYLYNNTGALQTSQNFTLNYSENNTILLTEDHILYVGSNTETGKYSITDVSISDYSSYDAKFTQIIQIKEDMKTNPDRQYTEEEYKVYLRFKKLKASYLTPDANNIIMLNNVIDNNGNAIDNIIVNIGMQSATITDLILDKQNTKQQLSSFFASTIDKVEPILQKDFINFTNTSSHININQEGYILYPDKIGGGIWQNNNPTSPGNDIILNYLSNTEITDFVIPKDYELVLEFNPNNSANLTIQEFTSMNTNYKDWCFIISNTTAGITNNQIAVYPFNALQDPAIIGYNPTVSFGFAWYLDADRNNVMGFNLQNDMYRLKLRYLK